MIGNGAFYRKQVVGVNTLAKIIPEMMKEAGISGNYTGHSGKVTCATELFNAGVPEKLVKERTGHRSVAVQL